MRVYFIEDEQGRPRSYRGVTVVNDIPDLVTEMIIGSSPVTDMWVDMDSREWQEGFGQIHFTRDGEFHSWNISSLEII